jgi:hypothetical protein
VSPKNLTMNKVTSLFLSLLVSFFCAIPQSTIAQVEEAPSLTIGLDKLVFSKGIIDTEVLTALIASKQKELKNEFVKRTVLQRIYDQSSFASLNYATNVLNLVLEEKNKQVLKREILEYSANYALVYGFTELYLQMIAGIDGELKKCLDDLIKTVDANKLENGDGKILILPHLRPKESEAKIISKYKKKDMNEYNLANILLDMMYDNFRNSYTVQQKGFFVQALNQPEQYYEERSAFYQFLKEFPDAKNDLMTLKSDANRMIEFFIKYYDVLKESKLLQGGSLSDLEKNNIGKLYEYLKSKYDLIFNDISTNYNSILGNVEKLFDADTIFLRELDEVINLWSTIIQKEEIYKKDAEKLLAEQLFADENSTAVISDEFKTWLEEHVSNTKQLKYSLNILKNKQDSLSNGHAIKLSKIDADTIAVSIKGRLDIFNGFPIKEFIGNTNIQALVKDLKKKIRSYKTEWTSLEDRQTYKYFLQAIATLENTNGKFETFDFANYLTSELAPDLQLIEVGDTTMLNIVSSLELIAARIKRNNFAEILLAIEKNETINELFNKGDSIQIDSRKIIEFIRNLDNLDKAETYGFLFKVLNDAGNIFPNSTASRAFNAIVNNVKKYTEINADSNEISVDVESIIIDLHQRFTEHSNSSLDLYLMIGINQSTAINSNGLLYASEGERLNNIAFASEKIGVKWKVINWKKRFSYESGDKRRFLLFWDKPVWKTNARRYKDFPIINDFHLALYGSGLLYNIANTKTEKNYDAPLVGTSVGISGYNGIDFNIGIVQPVFAGITWNDVALQNSMINFGIDVRLSEYLQQVRLKRERNKQTKMKEAKSVKKR